MNTKICYRCKQSKTLSEFSVKSKDTGELNSQCRSCQRELSRDYYRRNRKKALDRNKKHRQDRQEIINEYKKCGCVKCGYNKCVEALDHHHTDPNEKDFAVSELSSKSYTIAKLKNELQKCIVLCANCHRELHYDLKHQVSDL